MLAEILDNLHNYFLLRKYPGTYTIISGTLSLDNLIPGQYFRIVGSVLNDGVYKYPAVELSDETFKGEIWALAVPKPVLDLAAEIESWQAKHPTTDLTSESFGGYQYSRATDKNGAPVTWQQVFRGRLNRWRKMV